MHVCVNVDSESEFLGSGVTGYCEQFRVCTRIEVLVL